MDCDPPALSPQTVLRETGIGSPGQIHEIERAVARIPRRQCRNGIDGYLKLSLGLANALLCFAFFRSAFSACSDLLRFSSS